METEPEALPNEAAVEVQVLLPLIRALGYAPDDIEFRRRVIFREGRTGRPNEADIVLFAGSSRTEGTSLVVIEAKRPGSKLVSAKDQAKSYAANLRAPFFLLCDGLQLEVWRHGADLDSHQIFAADIAQVSQDSDELELLIGKSAAIAYAASLKRIEPTPEAMVTASLDRNIRLATDSCLQLLETAGQFRPTRCVDRSSAFAAFAAFEASTAKILPVVGASGFGKTYALASWAQKAEGARRLLMRGEAIGPGQNSLGDLVREGLGLGPTPRGRSSRSPVRGLVILLDGLNEQRFGTPEDLRRSWIPRTLQWLRDHSCKLVLTCRPEYWALLQDAFPKELLLDDDREDDQDATQSEGDVVFRLGDFTKEEAALALSAYGLEGRLRPESSTYPLLLAIAEELSGDVDATASGLGALLQRFVDKKVAAAALRLGQPTWLQDVRSLVDALAAELLAAGSPWISSVRASELFGRHAPALDALVEEHLLVRGDSGLRFQFDLVQEALQVGHVQTARVLNALRWVDPLQGDLSRGGWLVVYRAIHALALRALTYPRQSRLPEPSLAGMALAEAAAGASAVRSEILAALGPPAEPLHDSDLRRWRTAVTIGFIESLRFAHTWSADLLSWIETILKTAEHLVDDQVIDALADALRAPAAPAEQRLELAPLLFLRESDPSWGSLEDGLPVFRQTRDDPRTPTPTLSVQVPRPAAGLVEGLAAKDTELVFAALARWLDDPREPASTRGYAPLSVSRAAAVCLVNLRGLDPLEACHIALRGRRPVHDVLLRHLAKVESDALAIAAMQDLISDHASLDWHRGDMALSLCARQAVAPEVRNAAVVYWVAQLTQGAGASRDYAARAIVCLCCWYEGAFYRDPFELTSMVDLLSILEPVVDVATEVLFDIIDRKALALEGDDIFHLLIRNFPKTAEVIERHCESPGEDLEQLADGIRSFISPFELRRVLERRINPDPNRLVKGRRLVDALRNAVRVGGADAVAKVAPGVLAATVSVGYNEEYYLTETQYREMGLLDLTVELLEIGDQRIDVDIARLRWPPAGPMRERIFNALQHREMAEKPFGDFIHDLFWDLAQWKRGSLEEILAFRTEERADRWDRAVLRWIYTHPKLDEDLMARWLAETPGSVARDEFLGYRALGASAERAASAVLHLNAYGKRDFLRSMKRRRHSPARSAPPDRQ